MDYDFERWPWAFGREEDAKRRQNRHDRWAQMTPKERAALEETQELPIVQPLEQGDDDEQGTEAYRVGRGT